MSIAQRWSAPTPKFWKRVQKIAITIGAIAGVIVTAPITLPVAVVTVASYAITVGTVAATLSQLTVESNEQREKLHR